MRGERIPRLAVEVAHHARRHRIWIPAGVRLCGRKHAAQPPAVWVVRQTTSIAIPPSTAGTTTTKTTKAIHKLTNKPMITASIPCPLSSNSSGLSSPPFGPVSAQRLLSPSSSTLSWFSPSISRAVEGSGDICHTNFGRIRLTIRRRSPSTRDRCSFQHRSRHRSSLRADPLMKTAKCSAALADPRPSRCGGQRRARPQPKWFVPGPNVDKSSDLRGQKRGRGIRAK